MCAKLCAHESWQNVNEAAFISWEPTVLSRELLYSMLKGLQRPGEEVGNYGLSGSRLLSLEW